MELFGRFVAENGAIVREVQLEEVSDTECVSKDRLWHKGVKMVVVGGMLAKEAGSWRTDALASDLELKNHLLLFSCTTQEEVFFAMSAYNIILAPALVHLNLRLVGDLELTGVSTGRVIDVNHKISCLTSHEEALAHSDLQPGYLASDKTNFLLEWNQHIELRVIDKRPHR